MCEFSEIVLFVLIYMCQLQYKCYTSRFLFSYCVYSGHVVFDVNKSKFHPITGHETP